MRKHLIIFAFLLIIISCKNSDNKNNDWQQSVRENITIDNITYYFPSNISLEKRRADIELCQKVIIQNLALIEEKEFTNKFDIEFLNSRKEMRKYTGTAASGRAFPILNTLFIIHIDSISSLIKHEMMHMITMYKWGMPNKNIEWMNEGLATYAGGTCSEYKLEEVYKYFLQSNKIIPMQTLFDDFYGQPEMIAYTQSAYIVKFLIDNYGLNKFKMLWKQGMDSFDSIYGLSFNEVRDNIKKEINGKYLKDIEFDWELFEKGCG